jgi:hypothetical protein
MITEEVTEMEIVSAIDARIVEYLHTIWQADRSNPIRVRRGESESLFYRALAHLSK